MNIQQATNKLNAETITGWTNNGGRMITNPADNGGIIDFNHVYKTWFIISDHPTVTFDSLEKAVEFFINRIFPEFKKSL